MPATPTKTIYELALHETMEVGRHYREHMYATRVPSGWVYREGKSPGTFVPFSPEFKFMQNEQKRRDALDEFDEIEKGHGI